MYPVVAEPSPGVGAEGMHCQVFTHVRRGRVGQAAATSADPTAAIPATEGPGPPSPSPGLIFGIDLPRDTLLRIALSFA